VAARPGRPFRFAGTAAPAAISPSARDRLERAAVLLARHYGLRGLASVDALVAGDRVTVLEVNPRPGGSLDAHGAATGINLFALHVALCRGGPPPEPAAAARCAGSLIVHAGRATAVPSAFAWPEWSADRTPPGSAIRSGGPVCTVLAQGATAEAVLGQLHARAELIRALLAPACGRPPLRYDRRVTTSAQAVR
jgi:predicted ATP-grasp superfamily ATP-dependent carboligase